MKRLINGWKIINKVNASSFFIVVVNYRSWKAIVNVGLSCKITKDGFESRVGIWTPKCIHDWKTNITDQYQQCRKCGKGHAL